MSETQDELFRAPHEDSRPKEKTPCKESASIPTGSPAIPPKRRHHVKDHDDLGAYVQAGLGRVMMLDSILVAVRLEDPFFDKGRYPIEMSLTEYGKGGWTPPETPEAVHSEYERLSVFVPTGGVERRCQEHYHRHRYADLIKAAIFKLNAELARLQPPKEEK